MIEDLRNFLFRGNIVELAVAFVMGVAFAAVITSLVDNLIMPIIAMIIGKPDFSDLTFTINDAVFRYGAFITSVIQFVAIGAAVFFFVGATPAGQDPATAPSNHSPEFFLDESALDVGLRAMLQLSLDYLHGEG